MGCVIVCAIIGLVFGMVSFASNDMSDYYQKLNEYEKKVDSNKIRVNRELKQKRKLENQIYALENQKKEIADTLHKLYSLNILYPKYRNFVAVASFYEYFASGRCTTLEGHEGAYNIFENEIRLNAIMYKLDDVINHLEEIQHNQYAIYNAINEGNRTANAVYQQSLKILSNTNAIAGNSAITAYNSAISAKNSEILKFIAVYDHMK